MTPETESFVRSAQKVLKHIFSIPEYQLRSYGLSKDERIAGLRAIIAAANSVSSAASSILAELDRQPPDVIHNHYPPYPSSEERP